MHSYRSARLITLTTLVLIASTIGSADAIAQSDLAFEPYSVYVAQEETHARCGPSGEYYRTDPLRHGQALEVYVETDDGWLGIRPPDGSFCWIRADAVEMDNDGENGVVIEDRIPAYIGTHLGRARTYRWLVQLAEGEPVTVVGRSEREGPDGPQLWYRIVPPSGEYRWVHRSQVVGSSEELVATIQQNVSGDDIVVFADGPTRPRKRRDAVLPEPERESSTDTRTASTDNRSARRRSPTKQVASSGQSVLQRDEAIGSGLREPNESIEQTPLAQDSPRSTYQSPPNRTEQPQTVADAMKKGGLLASVEFMSRPRLLEIGGAPAAPQASETAGDGNWVAGITRGRPDVIARGTMSNQPITPTANTILSAPQPTSPIRQVSGQQAMPAQSLMQTATPAMKPKTVVSSQRIAQIEAETRHANVDQLSLVFSRLMALQATSAETEPVQVAARRLATTLPDAVLAGRARLLAERAEQYRRIADLRDGESVVRVGGNLSIPNAAPHRPSTIATASYVEPQVAEVPSQSGYLVQVYSARANSPPFALTDDAGRTVAYVTPSPGVNLRIHLNSKITVSGRPGFLTGLNTPHILASQAHRTPE